VKLQVAYIANAESSYMEMTKTSIHLLRQHNSTIPVTVILIEDSRFRTPWDFHDFCEKWQIDLRTCHSVGPDYFQDNKVQLAACAADRVLLLDSDTFIFADVRELFDIYEAFDMVACANDWVWNLGYRARYIPGEPVPLNSGVVLCSSRFLKSWTSQIPDLHAALKAGTRYPELSNWLYQASPTAYNREEFALTICGTQHGFRIGHFEESDCKLLKYKRLERDLAHFRSCTKLFHSYSQHWRNCVRHLGRR
jgi:hypothetical protein